MSQFSQSHLPSRRHSRSSRIAAPRWRRLGQLGLGLWLSLVMVLGLGGQDKSAIAQFPSLSAEQLSPVQIANQVYAQLPDLPLENLYTSQDTGTVATGNTLVSRLIRYHLFTRRRSPSYRFDWKLTLADYLGVHDYMQPELYPSQTLTPDPLPGDQQAIAQLTRSQRQQLVQVLVDLYREDTTTAPPTPVAPASPAPTRPITPTPDSPRPGAADLLR